MKVLFDTSVLVAAVVDQLPNHVAAHGCFLQYTGEGHTGYCSTHTLAECYATLTALPLPRRVTAADALMLVEKNFSGLFYDFSSFCFMFGYLCLKSCVNRR